MNVKILEFMKKNKFASIYFEEGKLYVFSSEKFQDPEIKIGVTNYHKNPAFYAALCGGLMIEDEANFIKFLDMKAFW